MTRRSGMRPRIGRVGLLQSDARIGSQTTRTVNLSAFSRFNTSSAAEAPRKHPGQVGDSSSTILEFAEARSNSRLNWSASVG